MPYPQAMTLAEIVTAFEDVLIGASYKKIASAGSLKYDAKDKLSKAFSVYLTSSIIDDGDGRDRLGSRNEGIRLTTSMKIDISIGLKVNSASDSLKQALDAEEEVFKVLWTLKPGGAAALDDQVRYSVDAIDRTLSLDQNLAIMTFSITCYHRMAMS